MSFDISEPPNTDSAWKRGIVVFVLVMLNVNDDYDDRTS